MILRTEPIRVASDVELDVSAKNVVDGTRLQEFDETKRGLTIGGRIFDEQAARNEEVARKHEGRTVVVEDDRAELMSGGGQNVDHTPAKIEVSDAFRPIGKSEKVSN